MKYVEGADQQFRAIYTGDSKSSLQRQHQKERELQESAETCHLITEYFQRNERQNAGGAIEIEDGGPAEEYTRERMKTIYPRFKFNLPTLRSTTRTY
jgi:hypothetical protein